MKHTRNTVTAAGCLLLVLALPICTPAAHATTFHLSDPVEMPFTSARSLLLVSVTVDGKAHTMIFDTGAERTLVHRAGQSVEHRATVMLPGATFSNFPVILSDLSDLPVSKVGADGVLGQDVLRKFSVVTIDYNRNVIILERK